MQLNQYILEQAKANGICTDWATLIQQAGTKDELMEMYVKGIDFCLEHNFPSNADLLEQMGKDGLAKYGVYVDLSQSIVNPSFLVALGECKISSEWTGYSAAQSYVKHNSKLSCQVKDNTFVVIDCFDNSSVNVVATNESKVLVNVYGNAKVAYICTGNGIVKIVYKLKSSY